MDSLGSAPLREKSSNEEPRLVTVPVQRAKNNYFHHQLIVWTMQNQKVGKQFINWPGIKNNWDRYKVRVSLSSIQLTSSGSELDDFKISRLFRNR